MLIIDSWRNSLFRYIYEQNNLRKSFVREVNFLPRRKCYSHVQNHEENLALLNYLSQECYKILDFYSASDDCSRVTVVYRSYYGKRVDIPKTLYYTSMVSLRHTKIAFQNRFTHRLFLDTVSWTKRRTPAWFWDSI